MAKVKLLNVYNHLLHVEQVIEGIHTYGLVPAVMEDINSLSLMNKAILRKHRQAKAKGSRKDIR
jgi:hypothetical protein